MRKIEDFVEERLTGQAKQVATEFVTYLRKNNVEFHMDTSDCWKDKIYYWVKLGKECLCFISIMDPDEPDNLWTVWSDNCNAYAAEISDEDIMSTGWDHIDFCAHCGACGGGRKKTVFGKEFDGVCGCTFRVDNPNAKDLPFLKKMVEIRKNEIMSKK